MLSSEQKRLFTSNLILILLIGMGFGVFINSWANTPVVYFNYPNNYCVEVISPDPIHNCENLTEKYQHEWTNKP